MKQFVTAVATTLLLSPFTYAKAQTNNASITNVKHVSNGKVTSSPHSKTEQELRTITNEMIQAWLHGDKNVFERYLADNCIETDESGRVRTRAQVLKNFKAPPASIHYTLNIEDVQVQDYGSTAVMSWKELLSFDANGQKVSQAFRTTDVYMKQGGEWKLITEHESAIPPEKTVAKVDPSIYDGYTGQYELAPNYFLTVTHEGDKLMGQATGQNKIELLPENETTFFIKGDQSETIFVKDNSGKVTHLIYHLPNGQDINCKKIK